MSEEKKNENLKELRKVVLPIIRNVLPGQIAQDLVGVQPMTSPTAQVFSLRTKYDHKTAKELIWDAVHEIEAEKIKAEEERGHKN